MDVHPTWWTQASLPSKNFHRKVVSMPRTAALKFVLSYGHSVSMNFARGTDSIVFLQNFTGLGICFVPVLGRSVSFVPCLDKLESPAASYRPAVNQHISDGDHSPLKHEKWLFQDGRYKRTRGRSPMADSAKGLCTNHNSPIFKSSI